MRKVALGSVCDIKNGYAFKSSEFKSEGVPLLRISSFDNGPVYFDDRTVYVDDEYLETKSAFKVEKGDVLIALSGATTGKYGLYTNDKPSLLNQRIGLLKSGVSTELDDKYFYFYLSVLQSEILRKAGGAAQPNISTKAIGELKIPLPPLAHQKKIAAILDAADAYRQKTKALIDKYDDLTQSLFLDMFGNPVTNPKSWDLTNFGKLVNNKDSKRVPVKASDRDNMDGAYPYYGASGIIDYVDGFTHEGENLLIGEDGANLLARSTPIAYIANGKYWVNNHAHVLGYNGKALLLFLEYFINATNLEPYVTGSAQPKLNRKNMDKINIFVPPLDLQNQFAERIKAIEAQKALAQQELDKADNLFNSLLQKAFKGELI